LFRPSVRVREQFPRQRAEAAFLKSLLHRLPAVIGWIVLAVLLVIAARQRFALEPVAVSEWDSRGWLEPALGWIGGLGFQESCEREWLYGAFLAGCLKLTGSFAGYVIIQQFLGLAAAILIWLTWRTWIAMFPKNVFLEAGSTLAALGIIGLYLANPISRALEMSIRPEAIMAFVAFAQLLCMALYCRFRWQQPRPVLSVVAGSVCIVLAVAMYILKPNWLLAVPATTAPVFLGIFGRGLPRLHRFATPAAGFALVFLFLWLPDKLLFQRTAEVRVVLPMTLFTIHADIIRESMAGELRDEGTSAERREFLSEFLPLLDREMADAKAEKIYYTRLGFDPDYLMYRARLFPTLLEPNRMSLPELAAFCKRSFLEALRREPLLYARKVLWQMEYLLRPDNATFFRKRIALDSVYQYAVSTLPGSPDEKLNPETRAIFQAYLDRAKARTSATEQIELGKRPRNFLDKNKALAPWLLGAFLIALLACLFWKPLASWRLPGLVVLVFYGAPFGNALTVAMVHALDNSRYRGSYGPLLLFSLGAMLVFCVTILAGTLFHIYRNTRRA
jgi:hypothetical protein